MVIMFFYDEYVSALSECVSLIMRWYLNGDVEEDKDPTIFSDTISFLDGVR